MRYIRAAWHDTRALVREFRYPLLAIFLSIIVGGWIYGELLVRAGYERVPYFDLPYYMLALMILEQPHDVPKEMYLIFFWYLQPLIGIYIIGRGAVDFIRLFFDRTERQTAWELAVASTYRNHVILIGIGHVGLRIARTLTEMGFEVVAVDLDVDPDSKYVLDQLGVPLVLGDARQITTIEDAGLKYARSVIICTSNDHINLEVTMRTRDLNPDVKIVARMWDSRFAEQMKRFLNVEVLSASDLAAPAFAGSAIGLEVAQGMQIEGETYSMMQIVVSAGSFLQGQKIDVIQEDENLDIVLHSKKGKQPVVHPKGDIVVDAGDTLVIFASYSKITEIVTRNHPEK